MLINFLLKKNTFQFQISILILIVTACSSHYDRVEVTCKVPQWAERWVYFRVHDYGSNITDSMFLDFKGEGTFTFDTNEPQIIAITTDKKSYPLIVSAKPGEKITLTYTNGWQADGSPETIQVVNFQDRINKVLQALKNFQAKIDGIDSTEISVKDSLVRVYNHTKDSLKIALQNEAYMYAASNPFELISIFIVNATLDSEQLLPYSQYSKLYRKVDSCLTLLYPKKQVVLDYKKTIEYHRINDSISQIENSLRVGMVVPPIQFQTIDRKYISIPGIWANWILLCFWNKETMCNSKNLKNLYATYKPFGFEVVSFGVKVDSLMLDNLAKSDTLGWYRVALNDSTSINKLQLYGIARLPGNLLIDRSGKVLSKHLTVNDLASKLDSLRRVPKPKPVLRPIIDSVLTNTTR